MRWTPANQTIDWSEANVAMLKDMWASGKSGGQIAVALGQGATRSAVLGKIGRMKLFGRTDAPSRPVKPKPEPEPKPEPLIILAPIILVEPPPSRVAMVCEPVGIEDLEDRHCRCIVRNDEAGAALYCGSPRDWRSSYCAPHRLENRREAPNRSLAPLPRTAFKKSLNIGVYS